MAGRGGVDRPPEGVSFATPFGFNIAGVGVILILAALYASWW